MTMKYLTIVLLAAASCGPGKEIKYTAARGSPQGDTVVFFKKNGGSDTLIFLPKKLNLPHGI